MKKVIVTGANGFIGTALCKKLSDEGINVIAIVRDKEDAPIPRHCRQINTQ